MGLFGGLVNTWSDGYQFGDILKSALYDINPLAWAGDALAHIGDKDFNFFENNPNWTPSDQDPIHQGIVNTFNKMTGNAHLTPEYQHEEQLEAQKNQIIANDLQKAGISKYAMSPSSFSSPSTSGRGGDMLQAIAATQQIASNAQALKERVYNYKTSKALGIRTSDANPFTQYVALAKILTGKDLTDLPSNGVLGYLGDLVGQFFGNWKGFSFGGFGSGENNVVSSANADITKSVFPYVAPSLNTRFKLRKMKGLEVLGRNASNDTSKKALESFGLDTEPKSIPVDFKESADTFVRKMLSDHKWSSENVDLLAYQLSKRYNLSKDVVLDYLFDAWDRLHGQY